MKSHINLSKKNVILILISLILFLLVSSILMLIFNRNEYYINDITSICSNKKELEMKIYSQPIAINKGNGFIKLKSQISERENEFLITNNKFEQRYPIFSNNNFNIDNTIKFSFINTNTTKGKIKNKKIIDKTNKQGVYYKNIFNKTDMFISPTNLGSNISVFIKEKSTNFLDFYIDNKNLTFKTTEPGYIMIYNKETNEEIGIVQKPIIVCNNEFYLNSYYEMKYINEKVCIRLNLDKTLDNVSKNLININFSIEKRITKQPDSQINNINKYENSFLSDFSLIGKKNNNEYKNCYKFSLPNLDFSKYKVEKAILYIRTLTTTKTNFYLSDIQNDWCSLTLNWTSDLIIGDIIAKGNQKNNIISFDITKQYEYFIQNKSNNMSERGLILTSDNQNILYTNDNGLYNSYVNLILIKK